MIVLKSPRELKLMREAGRIVAITLAALAERIKPGISTAQLEGWAVEIIRKHKAIPSFKGYRGYPGAICVCVNREVVHGIPRKGRILREGDIVSIDVGVIYRGYHGDAAITVGVGEISDEARWLIEVTKGALKAGIAAARAGNRLGDVSWAIQSYAESRGYNVVREYTGHGIGRQMHEEPQVPNFGQPHKGVVLKPGMTFALEPMVTKGSGEVKVLKDGWTVVTKDGALAAHFEHTVAVTDGEAEILTKL
ncbi:MAG: type I methionyl aminopeptidase [Chloroflexi bacterium]|nr:MAG: type I methionyl aminopeptidase [Chloroflexota bacterium]HDN79347.1 type I methionyl aminopeptidase [Chloroflexota bacterium]